MNRIWTRTGLLLLLALPGTPASALVVDLVDGSGTLDWDTSISVTSPPGNTGVTHPLFNGNRHSHEGWFIYLVDVGVLHEFTSFTSLGNGVSQDSITSTFNFLTETFILNLTYGITAVGPDGLPDLGWNGTLFRGQNPFSPFPVMNVRLFNVFDYDIGDDPSMDSGTAMAVPGPGTQMDFMGSDGIDGVRGAFLNSAYTVDTLPNVLSQITGSFALNNVAAAGNYDVAGAFQWDKALCASPTAAPECSGSGSGQLGGFGGFGGFGASNMNMAPEPSLTLPVLAGLAALARAGGRPRRG